MNGLLVAAQISRGVALAMVIGSAGMLLLMVAAFCFYMIWWYRLRYLRGVRSSRFWTPTDKFDIDRDVVCINKDPDRDFVILTLADIQVHDRFRLGKKRVIYRTIQSAISRVNPDLVVLLGDNCWGYSRQCYRRLVQLMDEFCIPWAPVFGNHDCEGNADTAYLANILEGSKYCVFRQGPRNVTGIGNYAINVEQNGEVIHTLFLFDTGTWQIDYDESKVRYLPADEKMRMDMPAYFAERVTEGEHVGEVSVGDCWGTLSYQQIQYYEWLLRGIIESNGGKMPESSMYLHIPLYEYNDAYFDWVKGGRDPRMGFGEVNEKICSPAVSTGMFDTIVRYGSTRNVVAGHDHENNFSAIYRGVRLSYGMKCADECSWREYMSGGSMLTVDAEGRVGFEHVYIPPRGLRHGEGLLGKIFK